MTGTKTSGGQKAFALGAALVVFVLLLATILAATQGGRSEIDVLLRRSKGERVGERLTPGQAGYTVEARQGGRVVDVTIPDFKGKAVFLNFWGTFCPPCIEELPSLLGLARARSDDLVVLAVSYDDSWQAIDDFFRRFTSETLPPNFIVLRDPARTPGRDLKAAFGTEKLPESYLLRDSMIEAKFVSSRDWMDPDVVGLLNVIEGK